MSCLTKSKVNHKPCRYRSLRKFLNACASLLSEPRCMWPQTMVHHIKHLACQHLTIQCCACHKLVISPVLFGRFLGAEANELVFCTNINVKSWQDVVCRPCPHWLRPVLEVLASLLAQRSQTPELFPYTVGSSTRWMQGHHVQVHGQDAPPPRARLQSASAKTPGHATGLKQPASLGWRSGPSATSCLHTREALSMMSASAAI